MKTLKLMELNAENLVINWEKKAPPENFNDYSEQDWQKLTVLNYPNKELLKTQALADAILDESPDVVAMVEIMGSHSLNNFNSHFLNNEYQVLYNPTNSNRGIDMGFLIKKNSEFTPVITSHNRLNVVLSDGYVRRFSRGVSELKLMDANNHPKFIILLVHLKSQLSSKQDLNGFDQRRAEIVSLIDLYKKIETENPNSKIIITGDLNGWAGAAMPDPEFKIFYEQTDLKDIHDLLGSSLEDRSSHVFFNYLGEAQPNQLDYIFLNPIAQKAMVSTNTYCYRYKFFGYPWPLAKTKEDKWALPSDHYPQVVVFKWEAPHG